MRLPSCVLSAIRYQRTLAGGRYRLAHATSDLGAANRRIIALYFYRLFNIIDIHVTRQPGPQSGTALQEEGAEGPIQPENNLDSFNFPDWL